MSKPSGDALLGIEKYGDFHEVRFEVKKGDILVLYTDGLLDAESPAGDRFGMQRLKDAVKGNKNLPARKMVESVLEKIRKFTKNRELRDDVTLVVAKFA